MRFFPVVMLLLGAIFVNGAARADSDDKIWVAQCVRDNAGAEATTASLFRYCNCMMNKMDDEETQSVTEWEPTHAAEKAACRTKAKWDAQAAPVAPGSGSGDSPQRQR